MCFIDREMNRGKLDLCKALIATPVSSSDGAKPLVEVAVSLLSSAQRKLWNKFCFRMERLQEQTSSLLWCLV